MAQVASIRPNDNESVVASGDAVVLDRCGPWIDLGAEVVRASVSEAWIVDLALSREADW